MMLWMFKRILSALENIHGGSSNKSMKSSLHLGNAPCGAKLRICSLCGTNSSCKTLREMGFCENTEVEVLNRGGAIVCRIFGSRIGLSTSLAKSVIVAQTSK